MGQTNKPLHGKKRANPLVVVLALVYALAGLPHAAMAFSVTMNCHPQTAESHHGEMTQPVADEAHDHAPVGTGQHSAKPCCGLWCAGFVLSDVRAMEPVTFFQSFPFLGSEFSSRTMKPEPPPPRPA